jgi:hypothetical protein
VFANDWPFLQDLLPDRMLTATGILLLPIQLQGFYFCKKEIPVKKYSCTQIKKDFAQVLQHSKTAEGIQCLLFILDERT